MSKKVLVFLGIIFLIVILFFWRRNNNQKQNKKDSIATVVPTATVIPPLFSSPIDNSKNRVTKKPFGIYITPQDFPVQPEKFQGFHTGVDFETFSTEQNTTVAIRAICSGKLILREYASGYGGVLVEACILNNEPITVIYGHVKRASVKFNVDDSIKSGEILGELGAGYSSETDGERKHLHLGIHRGAEINILGYVSSKDQLVNWIDPCFYVCR